MHQIGKDRFGVAGWRMKFSRYKYTAIDLLFNDRFLQNFNRITGRRLSQLNLFRRVKKAAAKFSHFSFPIENYTDSQELYDEICKNIPQLVDIGRIHLQVSRASTITQMIAFIILLDGTDDWTPELYGKMAQLFSSISNVESADVPVALKVPKHFYPIR